MNIKRIIPSAMIAAGVTTAIGLFMTKMIEVDFVPQDKSASTSYEINPKVEDLIVPNRREQPELERVETPPPPPAIEHVATDIPREDFKELRDYIPDFPPPDIEPNDIQVVIADTNAKPVLRIPPMMPPRAVRSGHCKVRFNVTPEGSPFDVEATYCTDKLFQQATIKSVQKWKFMPKIQNGRPVMMQGVKNQVTFRLTDSKGKLIPE